MISPLDTGQDFEGENTSEDIHKISMHGMLGHNNPKILRIKGKIKNRGNTILINSGRTLNFIQEGIALFLNLEVSISHLIMIGNGDQLVQNAQCLNIPIILNNTPFTIDFFVLRITGID